jgi:hypothetical protein
MDLATVANRKSAPAILLGESYRAGSKVHTPTSATLTNWKPQRIEALRRALRADFDGFGGNPTSGESCGVGWALKPLADQGGLSHALGATPTGRLAMLRVWARSAHPGSRLSAVRWAEQQAVQELLGLKPFDADDRYRTLDWRAEQQAALEQRLYRPVMKKRGQPLALVLWDLTSRYREGQQHELAAGGYNRDGKRGQQPMVIGLLTADAGEPVAVRVFEGNPAAPGTLAEQSKLLNTRCEVR